VITPVSMKFRDDEIEKIQRIREAVSRVVPVSRHRLLKEAIHRGLDAICGDIVVRDATVQAEGQIAQ